jgi:hypothetical protein
LRVAYRKKDYICEKKHETGTSRINISRQTFGKKGASIQKFMVSKSRVVMQKTDKWKEQISYYRFFSNERVTEEALINSMQTHCREQCLGEKHLLLIEDTTELNMEKHRNRIGSKNEKLGLTGNTRLLRKIVSLQNVL